MTKKERLYWSIKNQIGYCVITGDVERRKKLERQLKTLKKGGKK